MSCEILQIKKTDRQLLVAFKLKDRNSSNTGDATLDQSTHFQSALYIIACIINQCDFKLKITPDGVNQIRLQFMDVYRDHRAANIGKTFFSNTAFVFDFSVNDGESKIKCMEWT
ncbi:MAG: hypothetical protein AABY22_04180 [Nanoarchaeota archaeon]